MSEVPLSRLSRLRASSRDPGDTAAVRCSKLGDRISDAHGGRPRPGAIIVPPSATAEAGGGRAGTSRSGMAVESRAWRCLAAGRRSGPRVASLVDLAGAPLTARGRPPVGRRESSRPPRHGCAPAAPIIPAAVLPLLSTAALRARIKGHARIHGGGATAPDAEIGVGPADLAVGVGALRLHPVLGVADPLVGTECAAHPPLPRAGVAELGLRWVGRVGDELLDPLLSREISAESRGGLGWLGTLPPAAAIATVATGPRSVPAMVPPGPRISVVAVRPVSVPPPAVRGAALPCAGAPPTPPPRASILSGGILWGRGRVGAVPIRLEARLRRSLIAISLRVAHRRTRPLRALLRGSLGIDPLSVAGARPGDQAGDASSAASGPSVAAVVVAAHAAVGHGPVSVSVRPGAQAGSAATAPRWSPSSVVVAALRVVASVAVGPGPVARHVPANAAVRSAPEWAPLTVARAPVIDTVTVTRLLGTSSAVPRVTGSDWQPAGAEVARPGRRHAPFGEAGARGVPVPAPVALPETGVGVPNPAPTLFLLPGGAENTSVVGAASQGARPYLMLDGPGTAPVAVEVALPELPEIESKPVALSTASSHCARSPASRESSIGPKLPVIKSYLLGGDHARLPAVAPP